MTFVVCNMSDTKTEECVKYPTFDGTDENWPFYRKKMESYLARLDLTDLLVGTTVIPEDSKVGSCCKVQNVVRPD